MVTVNISRKESNSQLQFSNTYNIFPKRLLNQKISQKRQLVRTAQQSLSLTSLGFFVFK